MFLSKWLCLNNSKSEFVKIVYPGGHVELHDRPIRAAEIMVRNPKFCVAYPCVFHEPWAVVEPETVLVLGQKFYVVPKSTIRKLQHFSVKYSPTMSPSSSSTKYHHNHDRDREHNYNHDPDRDHDAKAGLFSDRLNGYFLRAIKLRGNNNNNNINNYDDDVYLRKKSLTLLEGSQKRFASLDQTIWQPNLESIAEE